MIPICALCRSFGGRCVWEIDENSSDPALSDKYAGPSNRQSTSKPFALTALFQLEPFVDAYFSLYHESYPIVHEATFRRAYG